MRRAPSRGWILTALGAFEVSLTASIVGAETPTSSPPRALRRLCSIRTLPFEDTTSKMPLSAFPEAVKAVWAPRHETRSVARLL